MAGVEQRTFPLVVDVDQLSLESPQHSLYQQIKSQIHYFNPWCGDRIVVCGAATHRLVKVHVVGEDFDVGVEDPGLANNLFQDVSYSGREDEQRDAVLVQVVEEELVTLPVKTSLLELKYPYYQTFSTFKLANQFSGLQREQLF